MPFGIRPNFFERLFAATLHQTEKSEKDAGLLFVSSAKMVQLNQRYAGKNSVTDVLSFETDQTDTLGDIVICSRIAQSQAISHKVSLQSEIGLLFVHGLLHLLGYDHQDETGTAEMHRLQVAILDSCGLEPPSYP